MKRLFLFLSLLTGFFVTADAQIAYKKKAPIGMRYALAQPAVFDIPEFNFDMRSLQTKEDREQFGLPYEAQLNLSNSGTWYTLPNGDRVWRLEVSSPDAKNLNVQFSDFHLPEGAEFYVYSKDEKDVRGAFTAANNRDDGKFNVYLIRGDRMMLEYLEPAGHAGEGRIHIERFHHGFKGPDDFGTSGSCNNNVNCPEGAGWQNEIRSNAMIINGGVGGIRWCSGSMVNNVRMDGLPYFLTANHCLSGSPANWAFMFNYQSPNCTNIDGPLTDYILGAQLKANDSPSDFALLLLDNAPPASYNVYHSGWDADDIAKDSSVGIHHPDGDIKKISFDDHAYVSASYGGGTMNTHWQVVDWDDGTTEPGSSGSPLYDMNHRVIGQLHGGGAACGNNLSDYYGKFAYSYNTGSTPATRLRDWLDPDNTGTTVLDGADFNTPQTTLDAAAVQVAGALDEYCDTNINNLNFTFRNLGSDTLTSAVIQVNLDGSSLQTINWTGSLTYTQTATETISGFSVTTGTHELEVIVANPNLSASDSNTLNDTLTLTFSAKNGHDFRAEVISDVFGNEISYRLFDENNSVVRSQSGFQDNTTTDVDICLGDGCYRFEMLDAASDGITNGGASLSVNGVSFGFIDGNNYTSSSDISFCICDGEVKANVTEWDCSQDSTELSTSGLLAPQFSLYPNPTDGIVTVSTPHLSGDVYLQVYNALGEVVHQSSIRKEMTRISLPPAKGIYMVQLKDEAGRISTQKLTVR